MGEAGPLPALALGTPVDLTLRMPDGIPAQAQLALATGVGAADWSRAGTEVELEVWLNGVRKHRDTRRPRPRARVGRRAWSHVQIPISPGDEVRLVATSGGQAIDRAAFARL